MTRENLKIWIKMHEGFNNEPYICTSGKLTIGYGRNLEDTGLSLDEAEYLLENDFKRTEKELLQYSWYLAAPSNVKDALFNMCFNLGLPRLLTFKKMIEALIYKNYTKAAKEALNSMWAKQVGQRAKDIALMIREGDATET